MAKVKYNYGMRRREIKNLMRDRLQLKCNLRYHEKKVEEHKNKIKKLEEEIDFLLSLADKTNPKVTTQS